MCKNNIVRLIIGLLFMVISLIMWWLSGFDFDSRGGESVLCFCRTLSSFVVGITCPLLDDKF